MKPINYLPVIAITLYCIVPETLNAQCGLQGQPSIDSLLRKLAKAKDDTSKAKTFYDLSIVYASKDNNAALHYADTCMNISKQDKWTKGIGLAYHAYSNAQFEVSEFTVSQQNSLKAYDIFKGLNDKKNMAMALKMIGISYDMLGYYAKALENHFAALRLFEDIMKALRAQMNPHFIFNSLHSINRYIMENDKDRASEYLSKFAKLMRLVLENSREQEVPLENDLAALELYMQLESLRFAKGFQYEIAIDPDIDKENTLIPPLMLQPFAENAIVHGIKNKKHGLIKINVHAENNNMIRCVVEDNGAGRETPPAAEENIRKRKSLGMKITQERLNIINQLKKAKAAVHIFDLKDAENKPGGLRIELLLPRQLAF